MSFLGDFLFWLHLASIVLGGAAVFGIPVVGAMISSANQEERETLLKVAIRLSKVGHVALGSLLITGPVALWASGMQLSGLPNWFWVKMILVASLIPLVIFASRNTKRVADGDQTAAARAPKIGFSILIVYLSVLAMAVLSFH